MYIYDIFLVFTECGVIKRKIVTASFVGSSASFPRSKEPKKFGCTTVPKIVSRRFCSVFV
jgi:hypothetical protein